MCDEINVEYKKQYSAYNKEIDTQYNDTQYNDTQYNDTQYNDTQYNDIQHNNSALRYWMLSVLVTVHKV